MSSKPLAIGGVVSAVLALGGIGTYLVLASGDDEKTTTAASSASPSPSASTSPAPTQTTALGDLVEIDWCDEYSDANVQESAVEAYGEDGVKDAYCYVVAFTLEKSTWVPSVLKEPAGGYKPEMFDFVKAYMTENLQEGWTSTVKEALNGDPLATELVRGLLFYQLPADMELQDKVINKKVELKDAYALEGDDGGRLMITLEASGDLVVKKDGQDKLLPTRKTVTYSLMPNEDGDASWIIDGFDPEPWMGGVDDLQPMPQG